MQDGFLRAAAASIPVAVADPRRNAAACCARIDQAHRAHAALLVLPELCVTGYTCGDLFLSALLLDAAEAALTDICAHTSSHSSTPRRNAGICAQANTSPVPKGTSCPPMGTQPGPLYAAAEVKQRFSANTS